MNTARRQLTFNHIEQAHQMVTEQDLTHNPCIIVYRNDWNLGVIGIVASKLLEEYNLPAIVLCGRDVLKGSVRSVDGVNFHDLLAGCADLLIEYGGHSAACGFSVKIDNLETLKAKFYELIHKNTPTATESQLVIDHSFDHSEWVTEEVAKANSSVHPYGFNNFEPIYTVNSACELRNIQFIGKEKSHIRFQAKLDGTYINCVGFGFADAFRRHKSFTKECTVKAKLAFSLRTNTYNSRESQQLFLHDLIIDQNDL
jgi:single-stranded-DNA-specific exonuclease